MIIICQWNVTIFTLSCMLAIDNTFTDTYKNSEYVFQQRDSPKTQWEKSKFNLRLLGACKTLKSSSLTAKIFLAFCFQNADPVENIVITGLLGASVFKVPYEMLRGF